MQAQYLPPGWVVSLKTALSCVGRIKQCTNLLYGKLRCVHTRFATLFGRLTTPYIECFFTRWCELNFSAYFAEEVSVLLQKSQKKSARAAGMKITGIYMSTAGEKILVSKHLHQFFSKPRIREKNSGVCGKSPNSALLDIGWGKSPNCIFLDFGWWEKFPLIDGSDGSQWPRVSKIYEIKKMTLANAGFTQVSMMYELNDLPRKKKLGSEFRYFEI